MKPQSQAVYPKRPAREDAVISKYESRTGQFETIYLQVLIGGAQNAPPYRWCRNAPAYVPFGSKENDMTTRLGMGGWLVAAALLGLLAVALWDGYDQWISVVVNVPLWGWVLMALGGGLSVLLGIGLMGLIFYSSRMGYDEPPQVVEPDKR
jgi:hypothetical protein